MVANDSHGGTDHDTCFFFFVLSLDMKATCMKSARELKHIVVAMAYGQTYLAKVQPWESYDSVRAIWALRQPEAVGRFHVPRIGDGPAQSGHRRLIRDHSQTMQIDLPSPCWPASARRKLILEASRTRVQPHRNGHWPRVRSSAFWYRRARFMYDKSRFIRLT